MARSSPLFAHVNWPRRKRWRSCYLVPSQVFEIVLNVASLGIIASWGFIVVCQMRLRKAIKEGKAAKVSFRMPGAPFTSWLTLLFLFSVLVLMAFESRHWLNADPQYGADAQEVTGRTPGLPATDKPGGQDLVILNQLRHVATVNFPLITRLIDIAGHPRFFIQLRLAVGDDRLTAFGGHNVVGRTACQQRQHRTGANHHKWLFHFISTDYHCPRKAGKR